MTGRGTTRRDWGPLYRNNPRMKCCPAWKHKVKLYGSPAPEPATISVLLAWVVPEIRKQ